MHDIQHCCCATQRLMDQTSTRTHSVGGGTCRENGLSRMPWQAQCATQPLASRVWGGRGSPVDHLPSSRPLPHTPPPLPLGRLRICTTFCGGCESVHDIQHCCWATQRLMDQTSTRTHSVGGGTCRENGFSRMPCLAQWATQPLASRVWGGRGPLWTTSPAPIHCLIHPLPFPWTASAYVRHFAEGTKVCMIYSTAVAQHSD